MKNRWKLLFFLLLGAIFILIITGIIIVKMPAKGGNPLLSEPSNQEEVVFKIESNKEDLNRVINHYMEKEGLRGPVDYQVFLNDEVELYGTIQVFSQDLKMKLTFEPSALENGDLVLKQKNISIGRMELPVPYVLKFIRDRYKLPEWVSIHPNDEMVYVAMNKMKLKSNVKVRVDTFDLKHDDISFSLVVPVK